MTSSNTHPRWWQLYLTFPLLIALFVLDHQLKISPREHQAVQIGIILLIYTLIYGWIKTNSRAISRMDQQQFYGRMKVVQIPPYEISDANHTHRPILQFPTSEVKGMLSDTFEMDAVNAKLLPIDDISQEINKEQK